jgi:hypothetical protein
MISCQFMVVLDMLKFGKFLPQMFKGTMAFELDKRQEKKDDEEEDGEITDDSLSISDEEIDIGEAVNRICEVEEEKQNVAAEPEKPKVHPVEKVAEDDEDDEPPEEVKTKAENLRVTLDQEKVIFKATLEEPKRKECQKNEGAGNAFNDAFSDLPAPLSLRRSLFRMRSGRQARAPTLLEKLLAQDVMRETVEMLQCVKFVCDNNFFGVAGGGADKGPMAAGEIGTTDRL